MSQVRDTAPAPDAPKLNLRRSVAVRLMALARQLRLNFDQGAKRAGLTRAKWTVIAAVARHPGATQRAIAAMLEVSEVTAGRLIDRLCDAGYLERRENPVDRRGYRVYLTAATQPVLDVLGEVARAHENEVFEGVDERQLERLEELLDRIAGNLAESRRHQCAHKSDAVETRR